ncbi:MAG: hypothetical protein J1E64_10045 [Acetatifactor sp.]|nr:hypothetical protein [Acetatifactor sp.]
MNNSMDDQSTYIALKESNYLFAVPMDAVRSILMGGQNLPYTMIPNAPDNKKYVLELNKQLITVIQIPGVCRDIPIEGSFIVLLEHSGRNIGILASETHLASVSTDKILYDKISGQKSFMYNGAIHIVLDICQLYKELDL